MDQAKLIADICTHLQYSDDCYELTRSSGTDGAFESGRRRLISQVKPENIDQLCIIPRFGSHTMLYTAVWQRRVEAVKQLLELGADPNKTCGGMHYSDSWNETNTSDPNYVPTTPLYTNNLHEAIQNQIVISKELKQESHKIIRSLIQHKADVNIELDVYTPLARALLYEHLPTVKLLLQSGAKAILT
jgi:ankyrin repeat protein